MVKNSPQNQTNARSEDGKPTIRLDPWEEVVDTVKSLTESPNRLVVEVGSGRLEFPIGSEEAAILRETLDGNSGQRIRVLRTDLPDRPLLVEVDDGQSS